MGKSDWLRCQPAPALLPLAAGATFGPADSATYWDSVRYELSLRPKEYRFITSKGDNLPQLGAADESYTGSDRRGAARDRFGNWYYISDDRQEILVWSAGCRQTTHFWSWADLTPPAPAKPGAFASDPAPHPPAPAALSGLAVTVDHYLVVGTLQPGGLLVFDLYAGGSPQRLQWPSAVAFAPFDMAARPHGGVWILDRHNRRFWAMDRHLRAMVKDQDELNLCPGKVDDFQTHETSPCHASAARIFPGGISLDASSPVAAIDPVSIEALPGEEVLILDAGAPGGPSAVQRYRFSQAFGEPVIGDPAVPGAFLEPFPLAYDFAFVPPVPAGADGTLGDLFVVGRDGNQSFHFVLRVTGDQLELDPAFDYYPMRLFSGMGLVAAGGQAFYDSNGRWVPLVQLDRPQYLETAEIVTPVFDGRDPGCMWHRLLFDGCVPSETSVQFWSRASDRQEDLDATEWREEPAPYQRGNGSELPYTTRAISADAGTFETLCQQARGRFLQLKIVLSGNARSTPRLRALRIYYPRFSYLNRYLPAVYREDAGSVSFLDRFLANFEGTHTALEDKIAAVQLLFDVRSAPAGDLAWLATWFGIALDPSWDELRQRLMIKHAMDVFQWRGTIHGLQMALHLALDDTVCDSIFASPGAAAPCGCTRGPDPIRIVEQFWLRPAPAMDFDEPDDNSGPRQGPSAVVGHQTTAWPICAGDFANGSVAMIGWISTWDPRPTAEQDSARATFALAQLGFTPSEVVEDQAGWRDFLRRKYSTIDSLNSSHDANWDDFDSIPIPTDQPENQTASDDWQKYIATSVSEPYGVKRSLWQSYLSRRYRSIAALNVPYGTNWNSFAAISYPVTLPTQTIPLWDWFKFESFVLATIDAAHRFTVLLPFNGQALPAVQDRIRQLEVAQRVVNLEKPAHTSFDVKFYWALFRLGDARLGLDTVIGLGGRDPALLPPPVLGQVYLAETKLAPSFPWDIRERQILGRDRLN